MPRCSKVTASNAAGSITASVIIEVKEPVRNLGGLNSIVAAECSAKVGDDPQD